MAGPFKMETQRCRGNRAASSLRRRHRYIARLARRASSELALIVCPARRRAAVSVAILLSPVIWRANWPRSRRWRSRLVGDRLEIHPIHAPEMAIEILETTAIHEVIIILRRRIDHAAGAPGLADDIVDLSAAIGRYANQDLAGRLGVGNLLGGELPILVVCHQHRMDGIGKYHA
jgi:hypothetical protein